MNEHAAMVGSQHRWRRLEWVGSFAAAFAIFDIVAMRFCLRLANADMLLGPVMATQRLTFFYWGQNRLANLVPFVSYPIQNFSGNFYVQGSIVAFGFFGVVAAVTGLQVRRAEVRARPMVVALTSLVVSLAMLPLFGQATSQVFVFEQIYALSHFLLLVGLVCGAASGNQLRRLAGAALVVIAIVVNPSVVLFVVVVAGLAAWERRRALALQLIAVFGTGAVLAGVTSRLFGMKRGASGDYVSFSPTRSVQNLTTVLSHIWNSVHAPYALVVCGVALALLVHFRREIDMRVRRLAVLTSVYCAGWVVLFSGSRWVERNALHFRYFFPVYLLMIAIIGGGFGLAMQRLVGIATARRAATSAWVAWSAALTFAVWALPGVPSPLEISAVRNVESQIWAGRSAEVDFVIGPYWTTWPAVFGLESEGMHVYGLTLRGDEVRDDVLRRADEAARSGRNLRALCLEADRTLCAETASRFLGGRWTLEGIAGVDPAVVVLIPGTP